MLDEIEWVTFDLSPASHWQEDFLPLASALRSTHQDLRGALTFIVAGVNPHVVEVDRVGRFDNPLFSTTQPFFVKPFGAAALRDMVTQVARYMGIVPEAEFLDRLLEEYGGHPFLTRQACSHLTEHLGKRPAVFTARLLEDEREHLALTLERNARQVLTVLEAWCPDEFELLQTLAQGGSKEFKDFACASAEFTYHVEGYGLVRDARTDPRITVALIADYLRRKSPKRSETTDASELSQDEVRAEISRRRNAIEKALREAVRAGLRFRFGKKAAARLLKCLPEKRRQALAGFSFEDTFPELYFNELGDTR